MPPVSCRRTAEERAQNRANSRAHAAAVAQALTFHALFYHIFATASRAARDRIIARALLRPRVHLQSAIGRCCRHIHSRVLLCRSGTHNQGGPTRFVVTRKELRMHCECAFPLCRTSRVVFQAQPLLAATKEVRSLEMRVGVGGGACECTREYELRANNPPRVRLLGVFLCQNAILERFPQF
jgi:hypothetical protein